MYTKKNTRMSYKSNRRPTYKKSSGHSNFKGRNKGNITQQYNKFLKLAKEAFTSGDRIQSEYYYQFTDHYYRLMTELGITIDENLSSETKTNTNPAQVEINENESNNKSEGDEEITSNKDEDETIESISFISEPSKEKRPRSSK